MEIQNIWGRAAGGGSRFFFVSRRNPYLLAKARRGLYRMLKSIQKHPACHKTAFFSHSTQRAANRAMFCVYHRGPLKVWEHVSSRLDSHVDSRTSSHLSCARSSVIERASINFPVPGSPIIIMWVYVASLSGSFTNDNRTSMLTY